MNRTVIQIGTSNGNDDFNKLVKWIKPAKVVLIEPNVKLNKLILDNYSGVENVVLENVAITEVNKGNVKLYWRKEWNKEGDLKGIRYDGGFTLVPMDEWGDDLDFIKAPSMTFMELCDKYGFKDIALLQIDTEGYDVEIIKSIDFTKVNIDVIRYEKWGFPEEFFNRHGEDKKKYGRNAMIYAHDSLIQLGYELIEKDQDVIAIKRELWYHCFL